MWVKGEKNLGGEYSDRATLQNYRGNVFIIKTIERERKEKKKQSHSHIHAKQRLDLRHCSSWCYGWNDKDYKQRVKARTGFF